MKETKGLQIDVNTIKNILLSERMSSYEKGEYYFNVIHRHGITQAEMGDLLGESRANVNRCFLIYTRIKDMPDETKAKVSEAGDRVQLLLTRLKEPNVDKKISFVLNNKTGLPQSDIEKIVQVLNGHIPLQQYIDFIEKHYTQRMKVVNKLKKEMLGINKNSENGYIKIDDTNVSAKT